MPPHTVEGGFPYICGGITDMPSSAPGMRALGARNVPMSLLANSLTEWGNLGRPVPDQTGLTGKYDVLLEFAPDSSPGPSDRADASAPLETAGPEFAQAGCKASQLGLKLEPQEEPGGRMGRRPCGARDRELIFPGSVRVRYFPETRWERSLSRKMESRR